jgi:DNA-directed RNA polymerase specialized sigma24 family protein
MVVIVPNDDQDDEKAEAAKPADAAVRQALIEGHRDILAFLHRRLGNREEAQEVLQRFVVRALERASDLRDVNSPGMA